MYSRILFPSPSQRENKLIKGKSIESTALLNRKESIGLMLPTGIFFLKASQHSKAKIFLLVLLKSPQFRSQKHRKMLEYAF